MSDLPSSEQIQVWVDSDAYKNSFGPVTSVLHAYASGRLVDREAIDRERIEEILNELCRDWYDMVIREGKTFDFGRAIDAIAAALGGPDDA
jgi:hypothetical protein